MLTTLQDQASILAGPSGGSSPSLQLTVSRSVTEAWL